MALSWQFSDYASETYGSSTYRSKLALHIKEVTEAQAKGSYTVEGKAHSINLDGYIRELMRIQLALNEQPVTPSTDDGEQTFFSRGVAK